MKGMSSHKLIETQTALFSSAPPVEWPRERAPDNQKPTSEQVKEHHRSPTAGATSLAEPHSPCVSTRNNHKISPKLMQK
jgi:hypothetical protein